MSSPNTNPDSSTGKTLLTESDATKPDPDKAKTDGTKGAPESYGDYKLPEGYTLDPVVKTEADALFKGLGLTQEQAQSMVDFYTSKAGEAAAAPLKAYQDLTASWKSESESHPDLRGKLGPGKEINVRIAKALDSLGDPKLASDFRSAMDLTGVGNHPAFIRVLSKFAAQVTEGTHVAGNGPSPAGQSVRPQAPPSAAAAMWPNLANR